MSPAPSTWHPDMLRENEKEEGRRNTESLDLRSASEVGWRPSCGAEPSTCGIWHNPRQTHIRIEVCSWYPFQYQILISISISDLKWAASWLHRNYWWGKISAHLLSEELRLWPWCETKQIPRKIKQKTKWKNDTQEEYWGFLYKPIWEDLRINEQELCFISHGK